MKRSAKSPANLIGAKVKELRLGLGILQKDLAQRMGERGVPMDRLKMVRLEGQTRFVSDAELVALAAILGTTPNRLLDFKARPSPQSVKKVRVKAKKVPAKAKAKPRAKAAKRRLTAR